MDSSHEEQKVVGKENDRKISVSSVSKTDHFDGSENKSNLTDEISGFDSESSRKEGNNDNGMCSESDILGGEDPNLNREDKTEQRQSDFSDIEIEKREIYIEEDSKMENEDSNSMIDGKEQIIRPPSQFPQPEAPPGLFKSPSNNGVEEIHQIERSQSFSTNFSMPTIGKFFRERSTSFSAALSKGISSLKDPNNNADNNLASNVTEINLSGLKVIVQHKNDEKETLDREIEFKGRISFFSRSNCRDCGAVRSFFREKGLKFVEINIDVFPMREKELIERTGNSAVPQVFFNEKLIGGLVAINSLRNSGELKKKLKEMLRKRCPDDAPAVPVYGFDDQDDVEEDMDEMIEIVRVLRQKLPIQDRLMRLKIVKNCFAGSEMVEVMIQHLDCGRQKAVAIGKELAKRHFIHHVFGQNDFEDGNHFYRFLEHEAFIPRCFNFRGSTNDCKPKPAIVVGQKLTKLMFAILESYASEDRRHLDYTGIRNSEEFRRYVNLTKDLQRVDILALTTDEKLMFFMNLYNAMVIHAVARVGCPEGVIDRKAFYGDFQYIIGGYPYSLNTIKNGILRSNRRQPLSWTKPFGAGDKRLEVALPTVNPLIHFGLCNGTRSSPKVRFFSGQIIEAELRSAAREFFQGDALVVDVEKRTVYLSGIIKWFMVDFGQERDMLTWVIEYLDATKAGPLAHLLNDEGPIGIVYLKYDWSLNT
ncbi:DEP domain [Macleaya cordata]|uniref:DEP domain n=1 Tax=Macleaya cordata TaxID=56857 RepID=A0A200QBM3_MACCD|nr:DEP domain [Macleaya cordata]